MEAAFLIILAKELHHGSHLKKVGSRGKRKIGYGGGEKKVREGRRGGIGHVYWGPKFGGVISPLDEMSSWGMEPGLNSKCDLF